MAGVLTAFDALFQQSSSDATGSPAPSSRSDPALWAIVPGLIADDRR